MVGLLDETVKGHPGKEMKRLAPFPHQELLTLKGVACPPAVIHP
jgi:hypothetical protein